MEIGHVQFQKGLSIVEFMGKYGAPKKRPSALIASRWPEGFRCPRCGDERHNTFVQENSPSMRIVTLPMCNIVSTAASISVPSWLVSFVSPH